jgi:hypothetical protein
MLLSKTEDRSSDVAKLLEWKLQTFIKQLAEGASFNRGGAARLSRSIWIAPKCSIYNSPLTDFLFLTTYNPVVFL